jgi:hypothetical protein
MPVNMNGESTRETMSNPFHWRRNFGSDGASSGEVQAAYANLLNLVTNIYTTRESYLRKLLDPRRDINAECGYPRTEELTPLHYQEFYNRNPFARRAVECWPKEASQVHPTIYEKERVDKVTTFEIAWDGIGKSLRGTKSYYYQEQGNPIWEYVTRLDIQSRIGRFGIMLVGIGDNKKLDQPIWEVMEQPDSRGTGSVKTPYTPTPVTGNPVPTQVEEEQIDPELQSIIDTGEEEEGVEEETVEEEQDEASEVVDPTSQGEWKPKYKLHYLRVFPESLVQITEWENDVNHPRYGQPVVYSITFANLTNTTQQSPSTVGTTKRVHWTRVIHVTPCPESNEVIGTNFLQPVVDPLMDLHKIRGSSGEMYYKGAFAGLSLETVPQLGGDVVIDDTKLKEMIELYQNGLQRYLLLMGMSAKSLAPQVVDPTPQINTNIDAVCIYLEMPVRIYKGSERGNLASEQDSENWSQRIRQYISDYRLPKIVLPIVDRFIAIGLLPVPENGYKTYVPDIAAQTRKGKADIALVLTQALSAYVGGNLSAVIHLSDFLTRVLGFEESEAYAMMEKVLKDLQPEATPSPTPTNPDDPNPAPDTEDVLTTDPVLSRLYPYLQNPSTNRENGNNHLTVNAEDVDKISTIVMEGMKQIGDDLLRGLESIAGKPINLNITNPAPNINVNTPDVKVTNEIQVPNQEPPTVNVNVPENPITVSPNIELRPEITIDVEPTPVNIQNQIDVSSPEIKEVNVRAILEKEPTTKVVHIQKNGEGNYSGKVEEV